jgi:hypothetical protein
MTCTTLSSDHLPVVIYTQCRSIFLCLLDCHDFSRTTWAKFQARLKDGLLSNPHLQIEVEIDACVEELSSAVSKALEESAPKSCPYEDLLPLILACIQDEICLKNQVVS